MRVITNIKAIVANLWCYVFVASWRILLGKIVGGHICDDDL